MVPINLALRDVHMEQADVTCSDAWIYNATFDLMTRVVDVINEIDPTLWLYGEILRGKERATLAQTEHFLFQYDGMHLDGEDDIDEYRMIWQDFATGWYKHPRRCILATRELSCAEQELLISQLRTEIGAWFEKRRHQVPHPKTTQEEVAAIKRMAEKLGRNGVSGAFLKSTPEGAYPWLFRRLGRQWTEQAAQSDASLEQLFDHLTSDNPTGIPLRDYQEAVRDKILSTPAVPGPMEEIPPRLDLAKLGIRDEYDLSGMEDLIKTLQGTKGEQGPSGVAMVAPPLLGKEWWDAMNAAQRDHPVTIITSTPHWDKEPWIDKVYRQDQIPTGSFIEGHVGVDPADPSWQQHYIVRHAPKIRSGNTNGFIFEPSMDDYPWKVPAGTAPAEFVRNGRLRPTKIADMVKFCTFVWRHADNWMDIIQRNHEQMHAIVYRQFKKENS